MPRTSPPAVRRYHAWRQLELLEATAGGGSGNGSSSTEAQSVAAHEAVQEAARVLFIIALEHPESKRTQALRWLMRLHRRGLLGLVLQQTTLQGALGGMLHLQEAPCMRQAVPRTRAGKWGIRLPALS